MNPRYTPRPIVLICFGGLIVLLFSILYNGFQERPSQDTEQLAIFPDYPKLDSDDAISEARKKQGLHTHKGAEKEESESSLNTNGEIQQLHQTEQQSLWQAFSKARRTIYPVRPEHQDLKTNNGARFYAQNPRNQIMARFLDDGVRYQSGYPDREWQGVIRLEGFTPREIRQQGTKLEYVYDGILEWYANRPEGMQQGFVLNERPQDAGEVVRLQLSVEGLSVKPLTDRESGSSDLQFVNDKGEPVMAYGSLLAWDANAQKLEASMAPTKTGLEIIVADTGAAYPITIDPLITSLEAKLGPEVTGFGSGSFGRAVSVDGDTALIGQVNDSGAYVFTRSESNWTLEAKLQANDWVKGDGFGGALSIDGDTALVGASGADNSSGRVYVFVRNANVWSQEAKLTASDAAPDDRFGFSVSLDEDTALIGTDGTISAYVFVRSGTTWSQQAKLTTSSGYFGESVSINGDTALIGAHGDNENGSSSGSAYVYVRNGNSWSQQAKLTAEDGDSNDHFGYSVSLDENTALIGAYGEGVYGDMGSAYVYVRSGNTWSLQAKLTASDGGGQDRFGWSVSIDGNTALIGAYTKGYDLRIGSTTYYEVRIGGAYVFERSGTSWIEQAKIEKTNADFSNYGDRLGISVCLDGNTALVGADGEHNGASGSGSAYVYERSGNSWSQEEKITPGDAAQGNHFGIAVSVNADTALIGAHEDDDLGADSGSAYVFIRNGITWSQQAKFTPDDGAPNDKFGISVSLHEDTALIGAHQDVYDGTIPSGSAYVYIRNGNSWSQQAKLTPSDAAQYNYDNFGWSVSLHENTALIGAIEDRQNGIKSGSAYVFERSGSSWSEQAKLTPDDGSYGDEFGCSVSIDGDTALIGAKENSHEGTKTGSAYVYLRSGNSWSQQAKLTPNDGATFDNFGRSVSLYDETATIGSPFDDDTRSESGSVYVFIRSGSSWSQEAKLTAQTPVYTGNFGTAVSLYENRLLVGSKGDDTIATNAGSAYVFMRSGSSWTQQSKLTPDDGEAGDLFGVSVSLDQNTALIGADFDDGFDTFGAGSSDQGSVYIFRLSSMGISSDGDDISDAWETANGFDINTPDDHLTKDSDADGVPDLWEIFQGTNKGLSGDGYGFRNIVADAANQTLSTRIRIDTSQSAITGAYRWSTDLVNWHAGGIENNGIKVDFSGQVIVSGADYQIVEVTAKVTNGNPKNLFLRMDLLPLE